MRLMFSARGAKCVCRSHVYSDRVTTLTAIVACPVLFSGQCAARVSARLINRRYQWDLRQPNSLHRSSNANLLRCSIYCAARRRPPARLPRSAAILSVSTHLETRPREDPGIARALFGDPISGCSNNAAGATSRAIAITKSASKVGFAAPVSRRDMYVRKKPVLSANSS